MRILLAALAVSCLCACAPAGDPAPGAATAPAASPHGAGGHAEWGYAGDNGPDRWAELGAEYKVCAEGREESPIDLRDPIPADYGTLDLAYSGGPATLANNGHTIQATVPAGQAMTVRGRRYELVQWHVHHPSEHLLGGRRFPLEFHLVHRRPDGNLGVLGVFAELGAANPALEPIFAGLPTTSGATRTLERHFDPSVLLPRSRRYLAYEGSLTTPPCTENVDWFVLEAPITVSQAQVDRFEKLYPANARPVQRQYRRFVLRSGR